MVRTPEMRVQSKLYDALMGYFLPPTDTAGRKHTLGRLATATFDKGDVLDNGDRSYPVGWAPALSVVKVEPVGDKMELAALYVHREDLYGPSEDHLTVELIDDPEKELALQLSLRTGDRIQPPQLLPLQLGQELISTQLDVAAAAQTFFDSLKPKN